VALAALVLAACTDPRPATPVTAAPTPVESLAAERADSAARADSIVRADSIARADSRRAGRALRMAATARASVSNPAKG
jgi:hypothetical protein